MKLFFINTQDGAVVLHHRIQAEDVCDAVAQAQRHGEILSVESAIDGQVFSQTKARTL